MSDVKHKVFISYHHDNDQWAKEKLLGLNDSLSDKVFIDKSVGDGEISDDLDDQSIRENIRDNYIKDASVLILLVGTETAKRKHIDWELYSSMYDGSVNKKLGILVIQLPSTTPRCYRAGYGDEEKKTIYPRNSDWISITDRTSYQERYPYLPDRIIDNLMNKDATISVTRWCDLIDGDDLNVKKLTFLIDLAFNGKSKCKYDMSRAMRRRNS